MLQLWLCVGATLWLLDAPERIWPMFTLGWASLTALAIAGILDSPREAAIMLLIAGAPLAFAGYSVLNLNYVVLAWACWAGCAALALGFAVHAVLALTTPKPEQ